MKEHNSIFLKQVLQLQYQNLLFFKKQKKSVPIFSLINFFPALGNEIAHEKKCF